MSPAWWISTYHPQPLTPGEPSTSQDGPEVLHTTVMTVPAAVARIGVSRAAMMSMPSWVGRDTVRKPPVPLPGTGATHSPTGTAPVGGTMTGVTAGAGDGVGGTGAGQAGGVLRRLTYASDTYAPLVSRSHRPVVRTR